MITTRIETKPLLFGWQSRTVWGSSDFPHIRTDGAWRFWRPTERGTIRAMRRFRQQVGPWEGQR